MRVTSVRLVLLRVYNITLGRWAFFSRLLRKILVSILIKGKKDKYGQSANYFSWDDLDKDVSSGR